MVRTERTSQQWFAEAERCYVEHHQGCAWCGGSYRVYRRERNGSLEYYCHGCEFRTGRNAQTGECFAVEGLATPAKRPETMYEV
jgi:hypothetical protein